GKLVVRPSRGLMTILGLSIPAAMGMVAVGVTYDEQGNGILLWNSSGPPQRDIFFTRISRSSGAALTATMPIAAGIDNPNIVINPREGLTTNLPPAP
ncbi:hypothetical protein, partial [Levilinea saccharolytica]|uniref:hypothetical protein n=1 Tax=Levilinea saccharolytica TaxID=229921 RepID=UPI001F31D4A3